MGANAAKPSRIAAGVHAVRLPPVDVTAGFVVGAEGALVVDPGATLGDGRAVRAAVERGFGVPLRAAVLTHGHWDHVFGCAALGPEAEVLGHRSLPEVFAQNAAEMAEEAVRYGVPEDAALAAAARLRAPDVLLDDGESAVVELGGGVSVAVRAVGAAHTRGDAVAVVAGAGPPVVFCGDLVEESGPPQLDASSDPERWNAVALPLLLALGGPDGVYVPGHGAPVDAGFVAGIRVGGGDPGPPGYRPENAKS